MNVIFINDIKPTYQRGLLVSLLILLLLLVVWQVQHWSTAAAYSHLSQQNMNELFRFSSGLRAILQKYESVPHQLSINPELRHFLGDQSNSEKIDKINRYLTTINQINRSSDIYILDSSGETVASSNWDTPISFIGKNFSFRPYFSDAMMGQNAHYYALGTTSNLRGYYFSAPISDDDNILGVVVLKISLADVEARWASPWESNDIELIVTDPDGVIFISTRAEWRLNSFGDIDPIKMAELKAGKRYGEYIPAAIPVKQRNKTLTDSAQPATLLTIDDRAGKPAQYLSQQLDMPIAGWRVHALSKTTSINVQVRNALLIAVSVYFVIVLIVLFIIERIRNERKLEQAKDLLELRVKERTSDLEQSNCRLRDEIDERHKAEEALKQTQEELIQAAKMAVLGQISAGINHELNQPLTAIRSYTQNAQQFLQRGNIETTHSNLTEVIHLTDHMASIIAQLKVFSRKRGETLAPVDVLVSLNEAIKIMSPQIKRQQVAITVQADNTPHQVLGDLVRLEQVFINLISNACQAMSDCPKKQITITLTQRDNSILIEVHDSGPGIAEDNISQIFEPFFTTKDISQGLGLGLSISHRIVEAMHGSLTASNSANGGAVFSIELPTQLSGTDSNNSIDSNNNAIPIQEQSID